MEERDYYEVLQLHPSADHAMIVQAYWHLALKYKLEMDRDAFAGHALEELNQAFNILGSPDLRQQYDTAHPRQPSIYSGGSEPETKRVSIEVCFWNLPAWQGMLAAACTIGLAAVALVAGAQPVLVFCLAVATIVAALLMLPTDFLQGGRIPIRKRWKRKLRAVDFEKSTSEILARWRQANGHRDGPSSLMELSRGGYPYQHPDDPPTDP
jgi:curved DNA-binding protein CbpA